MASTLWREQLQKILDAPMGLLPDQPRPVFWIDSLDREVAIMIAERINAGNSAAILAPHITGVGLALVARALAVATVGRPPLVVYTQDLSFPRTYKRLTMHTVGRFASVYPLVRPHLTKVTPPQFLIHTTTLDETLACDTAKACLVDARRIKNEKIMRDLLDATVARGLVSVFIVAVPWWESTQLLRDRGLGTRRAETAVRSITGDVPTELKPYFQRTSNYSDGQTIVPETVPISCPPLAGLEEAIDELNSRASEVRGEWPLAIRYAQELNRLIQDTVVPISLTARAAEHHGYVGLAGYVRAIEAALASDFPASLRPAMWNFVHAAKDALEFLGKYHPPKVEWFKELLVRSGKSTAHVLCRREIERAAMTEWVRTGALGDVRVIVHRPIEMLHSGVDSELLVPSPPDQRITAAILGGAAPSIRVLTYSWQVKRWNAFRKRARAIAPREIPAIVGTDAELVDEDSDERGFDYRAPAPVSEDEEEEHLRRAVGLHTHLTKVLVTTDQGDFRYREDALVPTLEVDRFVDRPVELLVPSDTIMVRTDGNVVDARRTVDGLAQTSPLFEEAARMAGAWRSLLVAKIRSQGRSYKQIHRDLFPAEEVTYGTVREWIANPERLAPNNQNLILLLTRLGLPQETAREVREDVRRYRSYRRKAYNAIYSKWRKHAVTLHRVDQDLETQLEEDETVDPELGISLLMLENLVTFAKVKAKPKMIQREEE